MIKIKANKKLFDEIKHITGGMHDFIPSIVQNDMKMSKSEYVAFWDSYEKCINNLDDWMVKVKRHIKGE